MKAFGDDLKRMKKYIKVIKVTDTFLENLDNNLKKAKSFPNIFLFADKTRDVHDWFKNIKRKCGYSFISFDTTEFYPSISEDLLDKTISWARNYVDISDQDESVIKHARKSMLLHDGKTWKQRKSNTTFDVAMESFKGAEVCELVGLYILSYLAEKYGRDFVGHFRGDGLILLERTFNRLPDKERKDLKKLLQNCTIKA